MADGLNLHGTAVLLGGTGVLLRGPSGSGKSILALALLERWALRGQEARLVADDRVELRPTPQGLAMAPPAALAGLIELRGRGIVHASFVGSAPVHLVVDLVPELVRMPEPHEFGVTLLGVALARAPVPMAGVVPLEHQILLVGHAVAERNRQLSQA